MSHPLNNKKLGRDYLWYPIYNLLETKEKLKILNLGGGNSLEWIDLIENYDFKIDIVDKYYDKKNKFGGRTQNYERLNRKIKTNELADKIFVHRCDILEYNFKLDFYDLVYARNSFHHIINRSTTSDEKFISLFEKLHSSIKPGGAIYIRETGRINYFQYLLPKNKRKLHFPSKTNLEEYLFYLKTVGFKTITYKYYVPSKVRFLLPIFDNKIANRFFTSAFMIYDEKSQ
jgi:hypothetical protein